MSWPVVLPGVSSPGWCPAAVLHGQRLCRRDATGLSGHLGCPDDGPGGMADGLGVVRKPWVPTGYVKKI